MRRRRATLAPYLGWLVNREGSLTAFLIFGIGTEVLAVIALFVMFRRRGWMGKKR